MAQARSGYDCNYCEHRHCDEDGARRWIDSDGREQQSEGPSPHPRWDFRRAGLGLRSTCPKPLVPEDWPMLMAVYRAWDHGTLLVTGGVSDQPGVYVDTMGLIASELAKVEQEQIEQAQQRV